MSLDAVLKVGKLILELFQEAGRQWAADKAAMLAAALAYYTVFSLAPLLLLSVAIAGFVFGESAVQGDIVTQIEGTVGPEVATVIQNILVQTTEGSSEIIATIISTAVLFFGASGVFNQLKTALNLIWRIRLDPPKGWRGILLVVQARVLSLGMVFSIGFLFLLSIVVNTAVEAFEEALIDLWAQLSLVLPLIDFTVSLFIPTLLFAILFKVLPDAKIAWRDVWLGAAVTAVLFSGGINLISLYLGNTTNAGSAYGAAGSLIVILLWIYYSGMIILFGAEFTHVYAEKHGHQIIPEPYAIQYSLAPLDEPIVEPDVPTTPIIMQGGGAVEMVDVVETADSPPRQTRKQIAYTLLVVQPTSIVG